MRNYSKGVMACTESAVYLPPYITEISCLCISVVLASEKNTPSCTEFPHKNLIIWLCSPQSNFKRPSQKVRVCSPEKLVLVTFDATCGGSIHLWLRSFSLNLTSVLDNFTSTYNLDSFSKLHGAAWLYWKMSETFGMLRLLLRFGGDSGLWGRHIVILLHYHQPGAWRRGRDLLEKLQLNISRCQEILAGHIPKPLIMKRFALQGSLFTV